MKVAIVVQRYGADINGGAELHARYIAERLASHLQVTVLTTCAADYITWRNALPEATESVHGIAVQRFPVARERDPAEFGRMSERVFTQRHAIRDELAWLEAEGPTSPKLIDHLRVHADAFDFFIFFSFRYYHAFHGARAVARKAILVPTAERDGALGLAIFPPIFRGVRAFMYNSFEERALIHAVSNNREVPGVVVGVGSEIPAEVNPARFRQKFNLRDRFAIYVGRIDENKGCAELFDFFQRYTRMFAEGMHLVLIGNPIIPIPTHPKIHHLGFVSDPDKFDALAAADLLLMPSYFESLSMVALEAWALGKPVLANGRCDVLRGQCIRSNGGLYYDNFEEFVETLRAIDFNPALATALGRNGREYFLRHYTWPVIERKYLDMLERLKREARGAAMEPIQGWFARRRNDLAPANQIVAGLPTGPALDRLPSVKEQVPAEGSGHALRTSDRRPEASIPGPQSPPGPPSADWRHRTSAQPPGSRPLGSRDRSQGQGERRPGGRGPDRQRQRSRRPPRRSGNR